MIAEPLPALQPAGRPRPGVVLALMSSAHAIIHAQGALVPMVYVAASAQFGFTAASIGAIIAATDLVGGLSQLTYGTVLARFSRVRVLAAGYLVLGLSLLMAGASQGPRQFVVALAGMRLGGSPQHPLGTALISDYFRPERRGLAISTHTAAANLGAVVVPILGAAMIAVTGWNVVIMLLAIPSLLVGLMLPLLIPEMDAPPTLPQEPRVTAGKWAFAKRRAFITLLAVATIAAGGRGLLVAPFVLLYLGGPLRFPPGLVSLLYTLLLVGSVVGPVVAGYLSDRYGRRDVAILYYILSAAGVLLFVAAGADLGLLTIALVPFGMAVFSESPTLQAILADVTPPDDRGAAFSLYFAITFGVGALWALVIGALIEVWGFGPGFLVIAGSYVVAALVMATMSAESSARLDAGPPER